MRAYFLADEGRGLGFSPRKAPEPAAGPGKAVIKVHAAGLNRGELLLLDQPTLGGETFKAAPAGQEFAGEIVGLGPNDDNWRVGDRVAGRAAGSYADYVGVSVRQLMLIPDRLGWAEAAAIPIAFVTAHDALFTLGQAHKDDTLLITAASSATGVAVLQLARRLGMRRILATTRSAAKTAALKSAGADGVIDVTEADWPQRVHELTSGHGADVIVDHVGGPMLEGNLRAAAINGRVISVGRNAGNMGACDLDLLSYKRARLIGTSFRTRSAEESVQCWETFVRDCLHGFADGSIRPIVDRTFPFERLADAHSYMRSDAQFGKIVLTMS